MVFNKKIIQTLPKSDQTLPKSDLVVNTENVLSNLEIKHDTIYLYVERAFGSPSSLVDGSEMAMLKHFCSDRVMYLETLDQHKSNESEKLLYAKMDRTLIWLFFQALFISKYLYEKIVFDSFEEEMVRLKMMTRIFQDINSTRICKNEDPNPIFRYDKFYSWVFPYKVEFPLSLSLYHDSQVDRDRLGQYYHSFIAGMIALRKFLVGKGPFINSANNQLGLLFDRIFLDFDYPARIGSDYRISQYYCKPLSESGFLNTLIKNGYEVFHDNLLKGLTPS